MEKNLFKQYLEQSLTGVTTQRYTPPGLDGDRGDYIGNLDQFRDFPDVEDPSPYTTFRSLEQKLEEQEKDEEEQPPQEAPPEEGAEAPPPDQMQGLDPNAMGGMDPNQDPNAMTQPGMDIGMTPLTSSELGRVFELKKIYTRLTSLETYLVRTTDKEMLDLRKLISQAVDLFEVVISNYPQYKDRIDEIIIIFYRLLDQIYEAVRNFFAKNEDN